MNMVWPPNETINYNAIDPTRTEGLVINLEDGEKKHTKNKKVTSGR